jgi:FixJ family two-component response regulator
MDRIKIMLVMTPTAYRDELIWQMGYEGFEMIITSEGQDALKKLRTNSLDGIVTQLALPQYDGLELILNIRDLHISTPIIVIGFGETKVKDEVIKAGASAFLRKPITPTALIDLIKRSTKIHREQSNSLKYKRMQNRS